VTRMQSPETCRLTARVPAELKDEFKAACDEREESMTEAIEAFMRGYVEQHGVTAADVAEGYTPGDPDLRELYQVCLDVATHGQYGPMIYQRRHGGRIAERTQFSKTELKTALMPLRTRGYVAMGPMPPELQGDAAKRFRSWIVKPLGADPEQWKYREVDR
jgi:hypothetical protein